MSEYWVIEKDSKDFPELLKEISSPPERLWVKGTIDFRRPALAIVGTRKPTSYGLDAARYFSQALSQMGFTIVSGLAFGIDTAAHQATLEAGGQTIAVLGSGIDRVTPETNARLAEKIVSRGGIISEFPPGTPAWPANFPQRNRLISGLSLGVLVIEAGKESGALITARFAANQSREVFALPGPIFSLPSQGTNHLIQEGAKLVTKPEDVLEEFTHLELFPSLTEEKKTFASVDEESKKILDALKKSNFLSVDDILAQTKLAIEEIQMRLTKLELANLIKRLDDGTYRAI